jgi:cell division septum initiation protein DivIVA
MAEVNSTKETLAFVLDDIIKNRAQLANQVAQQEQQIEVGKAQLVKFDTLIATLQVASSTDAHIAQVDEQAAANIAASDAGSPTVPASASPAADAGASSEAA